MSLLNDADAVYAGSVPVQKLYRGAVLLWSNGFDPLSVPWHTALWADDITGLNDGEEVTAWYDSTGSGRVTEPADPSNQPNMGFYVASDAKFNGRASVQFTGNSGALLPLGETLGSDRESFLVLAYDEVASGNKYLIEGGTTTFQRKAFATLDTNFAVRSGTEWQSMGTGDTQAHAVSWSNVRQQLDNTVWTTNLGANNQGRITLGTYISLSTQYNAKARIAFYGLINRNLTTEEREALHQWAIDYYGTPV